MSPDAIDRPRSGPLAWWSDFFFPPTTAVNLACLRIVMVALHLLFFADSLRGLLSFLGADSYLHPQAAIRWLMAMGLADHLRNASVLQAVWWLMMLAGLLALVGLGTWLVMPAYALLNLLLISFRYSFGEVHHPEALFSLTLLLVGLAPSNRCFSLDSWLARRRRGPAAARWGPNAMFTTTTWPIRLGQCLLAITYFEAFASKWTGGGLHWVNGYTLQHYLLADGIIWHRPWTVWLAQFRWPAVLMAMMALAFESTFWIVLFDRFKLVRLVRPLYLAFGLMMHLNIWILQGATFWPYMAMYLLWVPWQRLWRAASSRRGPAVPQPMPLL